MALTEEERTVRRLASYKKYKQKKRKTDPAWVEKNRQRCSAWYHMKKQTDPNFVNEWNEKNRNRYARYKRTQGWFERRVIVEVNGRLKRKYGIDLLDYNNLLEKQNGLCAICNCPPKDKSLVVDHCHIRGTVRGLLCHQCNSALGLFKDSIATLQKAVEYLTLTR